LDAIKTFGSGNVDILKNNRLCIDVKGNDLRIILGMNYSKNTAFIKWIGWHKDYDRLGESVHTINAKK
jgi:mRNA interferase HigB